MEILASYPNGLISLKLINMMMRLTRHPVKTKTTKKTKRPSHSSEWSQVQPLPLPCSEKDHLEITMIRATVAVKILSTGSMLRAEATCQSW